MKTKVTKWCSNPSTIKISLFEVFRNHGWTESLLVSNESHLRRRENFGWALKGEWHLPYEMECWLGLLFPGWKAQGRLFLRQLVCISDCVKKMSYRLWPFAKEYAVYSRSKEYHIMGDFQTSAICVLRLILPFRKAIACLNEPYRL